MKYTDTPSYVVSRFRCNSFAFNLKLTGFHQYNSVVRVQESPMSNFNEIDIIGPMLFFSQHFNCSKRKNVYNEVWPTIVQ